MPRLSWLAVLASTCLPSRAATTTGDTSIFEIDIVSPRINTTYEFAATFPVVYAFQNLRAALDVGDFTFEWSLSPVEGGIAFQRWSVDINSTNIDQFVTSDGSPYLLINNTWSYPADSGFDLLSDNTYTFYLVTSLTYNDSCSGSFFDASPITVVVPEKLGSPPSPGEIDPGTIGNVTGSCPYAAFVADGPIATAASRCTQFQPSMTPTPNPCAAKLDAAQVSSVSSVASALLPSPWTTMSGQVTWSTLSIGNWAGPTAVPRGEMVLAAGILGGLGLCL